ncbi:MAG: flagellar motor protein MotB [Spirochaetaceae bacterium]|nr:flagellar motor protein MotB [Spirochaetaceae bacterium]
MIQGKNNKKHIVGIILLACSLLLFAQTASENESIIRDEPEISGGILVSETLSLDAKPEQKNDDEKIIYISPNNDGVQDALVVPVTIQDKRAVREWNFVITDAQGNVVRTIGNKVALPETATDVLRSIFGGKNLKEFFGNVKKTFAPREGVLIPQSIMWNGILDSGEIAPDGLYYYSISAMDDNGNKSQTENFKVYVDNSAPEITVYQPTESSKIFGAGAKPYLRIAQEGSVEDLWTGTISDKAGNIVKTYEWVNASPVTIEWDGKGDNNMPVSEGVYTYKITSKDKSGNTSPSAQITNIIYDALPRSVNMVVKNTPFSAKTTDENRHLQIQPSMPNTSGLLEWDISILNKAGETLKKFSGTSIAPGNFSYNGKTSEGKILEDGDYQLVYHALFNNGQEASISRNFSVDNTAPSVSVLTKASIFSPDGDGNKDFLEIVQEGSKEKNWTAKIITDTGVVVKNYSFADVPPENLIWDGLTEEGNLAEDGKYYYEIVATDMAGNTGSAKTDLFELNTGTTEVILTAQSLAFSPNGDKVQDTITFNPIIKTDSPVSQYELSIFDENNTLVRTFKDTKSPKLITWNGLTNDGLPATDGNYTARIETVSLNGSVAQATTQPFALDTQFPEIKVTVPYVVISPNNDSKKDTLPFSFEATEEKLWTGEIRDAKGNLVVDYLWQGKPDNFEWEGLDLSGNIVADGDYQFKIYSQDIAGNKTVATISSITVDNRSVKTYVTADYAAISPNGDGEFDAQKFTLLPSLTEGIAHWSFSIIDEKTTKPVKTWTEKDTPSLPKNINWNGTTNEGTLIEGNFYGELFMEYAKGDEVKIATSSFVSSITPPQLTVRTAPRYFSPDNDGVDDDLFISLKGSASVPLKNWSFAINDPQNGKTFWKTSGKAAITERIIWDGRGNNGELVQSATDYPYVFTATDELGMTSSVEGLISVDVLVIKLGDVLKIQVPSIIFRSNKADFVGKDVDARYGLDKSVIDNNMRVLKRISDILNKFKDYKVTIEGHANNISGTDAEETSTENGNIPLIPLSEERAAAVKQILIKNGVEGSRLTTVGRGGTQPIVSRSDKDNWWKNRRVEFILNK